MAEQSGFLLVPRCRAGWWAWRGDSRHSFSLRPPAALPLPHQTHCIPRAQRAILRTRHTPDWPEPMCGHAVLSARMPGSVTSQRAEGGGTVTHSPQKPPAPSTPLKTGILPHSRSRDLIIFNSPHSSAPETDFPTDTPHFPALHFRMLHQ